MVVICEVCEDVVDELYARRGKVVCRKCVKKKDNQKYYQENKAKLTKQAVKRKADQKKQEEEVKERKAEKARKAREYRKKSLS